MAAAAAMLRARRARGRRLAVDGEPLTAEAVRAALRDGCAAHGAPAPPDIIVASRLAGLRPRPRLRAAAGEPADPGRPLAARRGLGLLGRHDPHVRRRRGARRGARCRSAGRARRSSGRATRSRPGRHRPRAVRHRLRRLRGRRPPDPAHGPGRATRTRAFSSRSATASASRSTRTPGSADRAARRSSRATWSRSSPASGTSRRRAVRGPPARHRRRRRDLTDYPYDLTP